MSFEPTGPQAAEEMVELGSAFSFDGVYAEEVPLEFDNNVQQPLDELEM